jgi:hypothetical protein
MAASGPVPELAAVDKVTAEDQKAVYPELGYLIAAGIIVVLGALVGTIGLDHWGSGVTFTPPEGVNTFALFYLLAQVIERVQEPFTPFVNAPDPEKDQAKGKTVRKNQRQAKAELERAVAKAEKKPSQDRSRTAANKKRLVDQIRANATVLLFATSAGLAMLLTAYLKADLVKTIGVSGTATWVDVTLTGLVVGAGTKPLHDLISNLKESKEKKQDPQGT